MGLPLFLKQTIAFSMGRIPCIFMLFLLVIFPALSFSKEYSIVMITWRGETAAEKGFIDELDRGGLGIKLIKYHADQDKVRLQGIITKIQQRPVDMIYVFGTTATKMVLSAVKKIPVVFNIVSRPVGSGIIASWEKSGNNATGASNKVSVLHQLKTLKKVIDFKQLGIIYNPKEQNSIIQKNSVKRLEERLGFSLKEFRIEKEEDIEKTLSELQKDVDAVFLPADSLVKSLGKKVMDSVNANKIPSLSTVGSMVSEDNVLMGFVPQYNVLGRMAAQKALLILGGEHPSDIPSSVIDHYYISVNLKTARLINIQIPMSVLVMANQIVR